MTTHHPDLAAEQAYLDHAYRVPGACPAGRVPDAGAHRGGAGWHPPGPLRAGRLRRGHLQPAHPARPARRGAGVRAHRPPDADATARRREQPRRRVVPHRPPRRGRRGARSGRHRLAGAGRRALLPGHRAATRWASSAAATSPSQGRQLLGIEDELFGDEPPRHRQRGATAPVRPARLQHADRRPRAGPHRPARRHRRHHPGRAGRDHPLARRPACSSCRAARAPARPWSPCTAPPTCSTRTASRSRTRACSSSGPTGCSCATSSGCCRRSARPASSRSCSADLVPDVAFGGIDSPLAGQGQGRRPHGRRASPRPSPTASGRCGTTLVVPFGLTVPAALRWPRASGSCRRPAAASAATTPAAASSRASCSPRWPPAAATGVTRRRRSATASATPRRSAPRSSACGRCSRRPQLLHDLFGSQALLKLAGVEVAERRRARVALPRPRSTTSTPCAGPRPTPPCSTRPAPCSGPARRPATAPATATATAGDEIRTYGHIVIDEVQDLTPMQLRMAARRSLNGSMTVVGDIAQATGTARAARLGRRARATCPIAGRPGVTELTVGYRIPAQIMALAARVLRVTAPALQPPTSVRAGRARPRDRPAPTPGGLGGAIADDGRPAPRARSATAASPSWRPTRWCRVVEAALAAAGIAYGQAAQRRARRRRQRRAGRPGEGPRARRRRRRRAGADRRRGGAGPAGAVRGAHPRPPRSWPSSTPSPCPRRCWMVPYCRVDPGVEFPEAEGRGPRSGRALRQLSQPGAAGQPVLHLLRRAREADGRGAPRCACSWSPAWPASWCWRARRSTTA